jgi:hypothetical protein
MALLVGCWPSLGMSILNAIKKRTKIKYYNYRRWNIVQDIIEDFAKLQLNLV